MKNRDASSNQGLILIYANSSTSIGNGHVLRQLALAQQFKSQNYQVDFIYHQIAENIKQKLMHDHYQCQQLDQHSINHYSQLANASLLVIDDYHLSVNEKNELAASPIPVVVFDDSTDNEFIVADIIVNAADHLTQESYRLRSNDSQLLLGTKYRLIRAEFAEQRKNLTSFSSRSRLLVTMGGSDVAGLTYPISKSLLTYDANLPLDIIIGNILASDEAALMALTEQHKNCHLYKNVDNIAPLMAQAGMAITAAGGTLYELATLGTPGIGLCVSENQLPAMNCATVAMGFLSFDMSNNDIEQCLVSMLQASIDLWLAPKTRQQMSLKLLAHYDGQGARRITSAINQLSILNEK